MNKKYLKINYLIFIVAIIFINTPARSDIISVGRNEFFKSILSAINYAKFYDTIYIKKGTYFEVNDTIIKPLTIIGEQGVIIDANYKDGDIFYINSNNVHIKNLIFKNVKVSYVQDNAAIKFVFSENFSVENCTIENSLFGIYLAKSKNAIIRNNKILGIRRTESSSGNGIHLWYVRNVQIINNQIYNHRDGIYFEFVKISETKKNICKFNVRYGLHFMFSDSCSYHHNVFETNGAGVAVMYTKNVEMKYNSFKNNWGPSSYGLLLKDISDSYIGQNSFLRNTIGIYMEGCDRSLIEMNNVQDNGWGLKITGNCEDNTIQKNNFVRNTFEVTTNSIQNRNIFQMNYWSGYSGYDLDRDGFGDVPYIPITLYSIIVQNNEAGSVLLRSFFIDLLEIAEKIFPSLIPKYLVDTKPAIRIYKWLK